MGRINDMLTGTREFVTDAASKLRGAGATSAIPPAVDYSGYDSPPSSRGFQSKVSGGAFEFDSSKYHLGKDGVLKPNATIDPAKPMTPPADGVTPQQRLNPSQPAAPQSAVRRIGGKALGIGGNALGVVGGGAVAANAVDDMAQNGMTIDNTTNLAGGAALTGGSAAGLVGAAAGAPIATGAGAFLAGKGIGGYLAEKALTPILDRKNREYASGIANTAALDEVAKQNPDGKLAQFLGGRSSLDAITGAPTRISAAAMPGKELNGAETPLYSKDPVAHKTYWERQLKDAVARGDARATATASEILKVHTDTGWKALDAVDGPAGATIAKGIRNRDVTLADVPQGGGYVVGPNGNVTRINAPTPAAAPAPMSDRDMVIATLRDSMANGLNGRARRDAAGRLAGMLGQEAELGLKRDIAARDTAKFNAELGDKRMKDFIEQHVNNQFTTDKRNDKGDVIGKEADVATNNAFLQFMRNAPTEFYTGRGVKGFDALTSLPAEQRNALVGELRQAFLERNLVNDFSKKREYFRKNDLADGPLSIGAPRESSIGDVLDIGPGQYLWTNMLGTNRDVVTVRDRLGNEKTISAAEYIAEGTEGSGERKAKLYPEKKGK